MSEHSHSELVEGCYRCELSRDEMAGVIEDLAKALNCGATYTAGTPGWTGEHHFVCQRHGGYDLSDYHRHLADAALRWMAER